MRSFSILVTLTPRLGHQRLTHPLLLLSVYSKNGISRIRILHRPIDEQNLRQWFSSTEMRPLHTTLRLQRRRTRPSGKDERFRRLQNTLLARYQRWPHFILNPKTEPALGDAHDTTSFRPQLPIHLLDACRKPMHLQHFVLHEPERARLRPRAQVLPQGYPITQRFVNRSISFASSSSSGQTKRQTQEAIHLPVLPTSIHQIVQFADPRKDAYRRTTLLV